MLCQKGGTKDTTSDPNLAEMKGVLKRRLKLKTLLCRLLIGKSNYFLCVSWPRLVKVNYINFYKTFMEGQPPHGPPMEGQPMQGQPMQGQPMQGQPMQGQPMQGQPMQGQPMQGQPMQGAYMAQGGYMPANGVSDKSFIVLVLLSLFGGTLGLARFYAGLIGLVILKLLTLGGCFIWALVDLIIAVTGGFKDEKGLPIKNG